MSFIIDCKRKCEVQINLCSYFSYDKERKIINLVPKNDPDIDFSPGKTNYNILVNEGPVKGR